MTANIVKQPPLTRWITSSTGWPTSTPYNDPPLAPATDKNNTLHQATPLLSTELSVIFERYRNSVNKCYGLLSSVNASDNYATENKRGAPCLDRLNKIITFQLPSMNNKHQAPAVALAESCARGAFNPATNQQLLGVGRSFHVLPQPLINQREGTLDRNALANFHTNTMAQLLRRLSGIEYKLQLNSANIKHRGEIALDLSLLKRASLFTAARLIFGDLSHALNNQLLHYMHRHVLFQIRNAALRAGEQPYEALKDSLVKIYGDRARDLRAIFNTQGFSTATLEHNAASSIHTPNSNTLSPTAGTRLYQLISLPLNTLLDFQKLAQTALPDLRETLIYIKGCIKHGQLLDYVTPLTAQPKTENLLEKVSHPHRFIYGLSTKSLERQLAETELNQRGWQYWEKYAFDNLNHLKEAQLQKEIFARELRQLTQSTTQKRTTNTKALRQSIHTLNAFINNLQHKQEIYTARTQRFKNAYYLKAKRVLQSVAPTGFEQQYAQRGFQHTGHISAPNPYLAQRIASETSYDRHRLMDETAQLVNLYDRTRREAQRKAGHLPPNTTRGNMLQKNVRHIAPQVRLALKQVKSLIKLNACVLKVRRRLPEEALGRILCQLDNVFEKFHPSSNMSKTHLIHAPKLSDQWHKLMSASKKSPQQAMVQSQLFSQQLDQALSQLAHLPDVPEVFHPPQAEQRLRSLFAEFGVLSPSGKALNAPQALSQLNNYNTHHQEIRKVNAVDQLEKQNVFEKAFAPLNQAIMDYLKLPSATSKSDAELTSTHLQPQSELDLQNQIGRHLLDLMDNTITGDELVNVYNTLIYSLNRILGDASGRHRHAGSALTAYDATQQLRARLPEPIALRYGIAGYLDSLKNQRAQDLKQRFIQLLACLTTDISNTNLPRPNSTRQGDSNQPYPLWQAIQDRTLMQSERDAAIVEAVFQPSSPHISELEAVVSQFSSAASDKQKQIRALSDVYQQVITSLNKAGAQINLKAGIGPGSFGNERSTLYHANILYDAILASQSHLQKDGHTNKESVITKRGLAIGLFHYIQQDLQHHFRRTDLDLASLRDRFLWNRHSAAAAASTQILSALIGDWDTQGKPRGLFDPAGRLAQLHQDYNRTVDMPAQMITQGVVNAAMLGSFFGAVPAVIFNPILMFTPLPVSLLNFGDWIAMSSFGTIAATPLTLIANIERRKNNITLREQAAQAAQKIIDEQKTHGKQALINTIPISQWSSYPPVHYTRNKIIQPFVNLFDRMIGHAARTLPHATDKRLSTNTPTKLDNHPNYYKKPGQGFSVSPLAQAGAILGETKRWVGQDLIAAPLISFFQLPWSISRLIYRDLLSPRLSNQGPVNPNQWQKTWQLYDKQEDARGTTKGDYLRQFVVPAETAR